MCEVSKGASLIPQCTAQLSSGVISYPDLTLFFTPFPLAMGDLGTRLALGCKAGD